MTAFRRLFRTYDAHRIKQLIWRRSTSRNSLNGPASHSRPHRSSSSGLCSCSTSTMGHGQDRMPPNSLQHHPTLLPLGSRSVRLEPVRSACHHSDAVRRPPMRCPAKFWSPLPAAVNTSAPLGHPGASHMTDSAAQPMRLAGTVPRLALARVKRPGPRYQSQRRSAARCAMARPARQHQGSRAGTLCLFFLSAPLSSPLFFVLIVYPYPSLLWSQCQDTVPRSLDSSHS